MRLKPRLLARDMLAGVLAAGVLLPSALAYALLAGLRPEAGLAALVLPPLVYELLASSRYISVSPTGQASALVAIGVGGLAAGDPARHAALAATLALMVGALLLAAGLLRLGFLTDFISRPVFIGYGLGAALTVITSQLPALLGVKVDGIRFSQVLPRLLGALDGLRPLPALFGLGCLAVYFLARRWVRHIPPALVTLGVAGGVVAGFHLDERGLAVVGALPRGRLTLALPAFSLADARALLPVALVLFLLVFLDSNSLGRGLATKHGEPLRANRELLGLGAMNVTAGLAAAFPMSANSSSSRIYEVLGARAFVARLVTTAISAGALVLAPSFPNLSRAALAVVVIGTVVEAVDWRASWGVWHFSRQEALLGGVAFTGVLTLGLVPGMLLAAIASILVLIYRAAHPHIVQLGEAPDHPEGFADMAHDPGSRPIPGVLVFRVESALFFANVGHVADELHALALGPARPVRVVVLDLRAVNQLDFTACEVLGRLRADLERRGIRLVVAEPNDAVLEALVRFGLASTLQLEAARAGLKQVIQRLRPREA